MNESGSQPTTSGLPFGIHAFAWGGIIALVLILIGLSKAYEGRNIWSHWAEATELRRPAYAERVYPDEVFRTQANTWSNLTYVLVGFYAIALGRLDLRTKFSAEPGHLVNTPALSLLFGATCCYLGFGSGFFHASLTRFGQQLDVAAMYAPLLGFIAINLGRFLPRLKFGGGQTGIPSWPVLLGLVLVASFLLFQYKWSMRSSVMLPTLILIVTAFTLLDRFLPRRKFAVRWMVFSALALGVARICWQLDVAGKFSSPDTWLQGHAVWHLLTGLSLACTYSYYRSERIISAKP